MARYNKRLPPKPPRPWQVRIYDGDEQVSCLAWSNYPRARAAAERFNPGFHGNWRTLFYAVDGDKKVIIKPRKAKEHTLYGHALAWRSDFLAQVVLLRQPLGAPEQVVAAWWIEPELAEQKRDDELKKYPQATHARIYYPDGEVQC